MTERFDIACCPEHGIHGERSECFVCGGPVEQRPMIDLAAYGAVLSAIWGALALFAEGRQAQAEGLLRRALPEGYSPVGASGTGTSALHGIQRDERGAPDA